MRSARGCCNSSDLYNVYIEDFVSRCECIASQQCNTSPFVRRLLFVPASKRFYRVKASREQGVCQGDANVHRASTLVKCDAYTPKYRCLWAENK